MTLAKRSAKIDHKIAVGMAVSGHTQQQIAERFGVTIPAVSLHFKRRGPDWKSVAFPFAARTNEIWAAWLEGMTYRQISESLGCSVPTVAYHLKKARARHAD